MELNKEKEDKFLKYDCKSDSVNTFLIAYVENNGFMYKTYCNQKYPQHNTIKKFHDNRKEDFVII